MFGTQCWNAIRDTTPKLTNIAKLKNCFFLTIWNDSLQEFIDIKATISFCNKLKLCVAGASGHSKHRLNTE